jgi:hypothetical protein
MFILLQVYIVICIVNIAKVFISNNLKILIQYISGNTFARLLQYMHF